MDRRAAIATAGAITLTVLAGTSAIAANVGILGNNAKTPVGQLSPVVDVKASDGDQGRPLGTTTTTGPELQVRTIYVDETGATVGSQPRSAQESGAGDPASAGTTEPTDPTEPSDTPDASAPAAGGGDSESEHDSTSTTEPSEDEGGHDTHQQQFEGGSEDD